MNRESSGGSVNRVGAVVVTFHPDEKTITTVVAKLIRQVDRVVLVDNGSDASRMEQLLRCIAAEKLSITALDENRGIAAAHNIGIMMLLERGLDYILLLDQDSIPADDMVALLVDKADELVMRGIKVAAVGPTLSDSRTTIIARPASRKRRGQKSPGSQENAVEGVFETDFLISSGSLLSREAFHEIGPMNEGYFIDHVDTEWCYRALFHGWRLFQVVEAKMMHALGDDIVHIWFGRRRQVAIHSPLRNYYELRNTVLMLRNAPISNAHRRFHLVRIIQFLVFFGFAVAPRRLRLKMMLIGIWHGLSGRAGQFDGINK